MGPRAVREGLEHLASALLGVSSEDPELFTEDFLGHLADAQARSALVQALIQARRRVRISQRALAMRMGTTQSAVSELERGGQDPRLSTLQRYARGVECALHLSLRNLAVTPALWPEVGKAKPVTEASRDVVPQLDIFDPAVSTLPPLDEFIPVPEEAW